MEHIVGLPPLPTVCLPLTYRESFNLARMKKNCVLLKANIEFLVFFSFQIKDFETSITLLLSIFFLSIKA